MTDIDKIEKKVALDFFRAASYLKKIKLYHEDRDYLIVEAFGYFYYDLEYYRLMNDNKISDANLVSTFKANKMSNIVRFFEKHDKFAYYHLSNMFKKKVWYKYACDMIENQVKHKKKNNDEDNDE